MRFSRNQFIGNLLKTGSPVITKNQSQSNNILTFSAFWLSYDKLKTKFMWGTIALRLFLFLTISGLCLCCHTTAQYDKSKKYYLSDKERKAETFTVDQAHALIEQNLATDHDEETTKRSKKQLKELQEINESPLQKKKKAKRQKSGNIDLY